MKQYHDLLQNILDNGTKVEDRTGVGTLSLFGAQMRFDLSKGFPAVTTKKLAFRSVKSELLWFLEGSEDERRLAEIHYGKLREDLVDKKTIWTDNADNQGKAMGYTNSDMRKKLGPVYGVQWREWFSRELCGDRVVIDQIANIIERIKTNPDCRRIILSAWNVADISKMALPPCHCFAQFRVINGKLHCQMYQRSCDMFLGVPFNIASYSLLTHMIAQVCGLEVGDFVHTLGDAHIYLNHIEQVKEQLSREEYPLPTLWLNPEIKDIDEFSMEDIQLKNYQSHESIKAEMAV